MIGVLFTDSVRVISLFFAVLQHLSSKYGLAASAFAIFEDAAFSSSSSSSSSIARARRPFRCCHAAGIASPSIASALLPVLSGQRFVLLFPVEHLPDDQRLQPSPVPSRGCCCCCYSYNIAKTAKRYFYFLITVYSSDVATRLRLLAQYSN